MTTLTRNIAVAAGIALPFTAAYIGITAVFVRSPDSLIAVLLGSLGVLLLIVLAVQLGTGPRQPEQTVAGLDLLWVGDRAAPRTGRTPVAFTPGRAAVPCPASLHLQGADQR